MENASNDLNNIHINIVDNQNQNQFSNNFGNSSLSFPVFCSFCKKTPLFPPIFYCPDCIFIYCSQCEQYNGDKHHHPYCQIKNTSQYEYLNIGRGTRFERLMHNVGTRAENAYKSVLNFFGVGSSNNNQNNNNRNQDNEINNPYNNQNRI